jgi:transposase, IS30 family
MKKKPKLNQFERDRIEALLNSNIKQKDIAKVLQRDESTISREIKNNSVNGEYISQKAHHKAYVKRKYAKYQGKKIDENDRLKEYIIQGLINCWNPDEISGRMKERKEDFYASKTAIYEWLYSNRGQMYCHLLPSKQYSKKRRNKNKKNKREMIPNRIGIEFRPKEYKYQLNHLEHDTFVSGKKTGNKSAISVLHEPKLKYTSLKKIINLKPINNENAIIEMSKRYKEIKSITRDNGLENKKHELNNIPSFFCDPYSSWQKPNVENIIKLLRRFFKKGSDLGNYSTKQISFVENILNKKPRKVLGYKTPLEVMIENDMLNLDNLEVKKVVLNNNFNNQLVAIEG